MDFTASALLDLVRDAAFLPTYDEGESTRLLRLLNRAQLGYLQGVLESADSSYRYASTTVDVSAGVLSYAIPARAIASGIEMVSAVDASGNTWLLTELRPREWTWPGIWVAPGRQFYLQGNNIIFYAEPPSGDLQIRYPLRLSELVLPTDTANVRTISTIDTGTKTLTLSGAFTNSAGICDLVQANPQFTMLSMDAAFTGSGTSTLVFTNALPTGLAVGDYVCIPKKSPVCLAPLEMHELLCQHVAWRVLVAKGDPKANALQELRDDTKRRVLTLLQPRPAKHKAIVSLNSPGWGRVGSFGWRGGGG